jgi:hypothetical protein
LKLKGLAVDPERPLTVMVLLCPAVIDAGLKEQVAPLAHVKLILSVKPVGPEAEIIKVVELVPMVMVTELLSAESENTASPVPDRLTLCGLPVALSVTVNKPVRLPDAVGVNVMLKEQLAPAARTPPVVLPGGIQVSVSAKSPVMAILVMSSWALPLLVSVTA